MEVIKIETQGKLFIMPKEKAAEFVYNIYKDSEAAEVAGTTVEELLEMGIKIKWITLKEGEMWIAGDGLREKLEIVHRTEDGYISQYCYYSEESGEIECESTPNGALYEVLRIYYSPY